MSKKVAYRKKYAMRAVGTGGFEVSIPKEVIEREARKRGLTPGEFREKYTAVALYNDFDGVFYRFEPKEGEEVTIPEVE